MYLFKNFKLPTAGVTEVFSKETGEWVKIESGILKQVVRSGDIGRYWAHSTALVLFPYTVANGSAELLSQRELQSRYPLSWEYLNKSKPLLQNRERGKFKDAHWYRFGRTQNLGMWEQPKLMVPYMVRELSAYLDTEGDYYFINVTTGGYGVTSDEKQGSLAYLCGLLNSRLLDFYLKNVSTNFHGGYFAANKQYIEQLPIRAVDLSDSDDRAFHDRMVKLVESMLKLHQKLHVARTPMEKTALERQIDATDRQIDALVYELYGLTDQEIAIVEEATKKG